MKNIILFFIDRDFLTALSQERILTYQDLIKVGLEHEVQIIMSSVYQYDAKSNTFTSGKIFNGQNWGTIHDISIDLVWYKSNTVSDLTKVIEQNNTFINNTRFIELASDKYTTSLYDLKDSPKTQLLSPYGIQQALSWEGKEVIIKPNNGAGGRGVEKIAKKQLLSLELLDYQDYIIQELIDSSEGIPGVIDGIHDIRFVMFGKEIMSHVMIRTPSKNDFRCNTHAGGSTQYMKVSSLPHELNRLATKIIEKICDEFGEVFGSIDLTRSNGKYYLIEYNSSPGNLSFSYTKGLEEEYYGKTISFFKKLLP